MREHDRRVRAAGTVDARDVARDETDERGAVVVAEQRELVAGDVLVARLGALVGLGQVHPELHAVQQAAFAQHLLGRHLGVHEAGARGHPLRVAAADHAAAAVGVAVLHLAVEQVGDGLEAAVRVVGRAERLARAGSRPAPSGRA